VRSLPGLAEHPPCKASRYPTSQSERLGTRHQLSASAALGSAWRSVGSLRRPPRSGNPGDPTALGVHGHTWRNSFLAAAFQISLTPCKQRHSR
jgi:hypothetical protein